MGDLKPLGSEKLQGNEKLKRILELTYYQNNKTVNESKSTVSAEIIKESVNGVYGIVKEKDGYYVKKGLNESSLDYIGGLFMKNKNRFSSYADALKRLELLNGQELQEEATKYVLKQNKPQSEAPVPQPTNDAPAPAPAPAPSAPTVSDKSSSAPDDSLGLSDFTGKTDDTDSAPTDDAPKDDMGDDQMADAPEHMKEVQRLCGKLGQAIREVGEKMEGDDVKYVINMVLSAVEIDKLSPEDKESIAEKFEPKEDGEGQPGEEPAPSKDNEYNYDDLPEVGDDDSSSETDMDETMDTLENLINSKFEDGASDMDEWFFDGFDTQDDADNDRHVSPYEPSKNNYRTVGDDDKPNRLTTSPHMSKTWYDDNDVKYNDFDGSDYDEEDFDDHDAYMSKHGDSNIDLRYKPDFERHKPVKVRTLRKKDNFDITPELGDDINEAISTTLSKYFE